MAQFAFAAALGQRDPGLSGDFSFERGQTDGAFPGERKSVFFHEVIY